MAFWHKSTEPVCRRLCQRKKNKPETKKKNEKRNEQREYSFFMMVMKILWLCFVQKQRRRRH